MRSIRPKLRKAGTSEHVLAPVLRGGKRLRTGRRSRSLKGCCQRVRSSFYSIYRLIPLLQIWPDHPWSLRTFGGSFPQRGPTATRNSGSLPEQGLACSFLPPAGTSSPTHRTPKDWHLVARRSTLWVHSRKSLREIARLHKEPKNITIWSATERAKAQIGRKLSQHLYNQEHPMAKARSKSNALGDKTQSLQTLHVTRPRAVHPGEKLRDQRQQGFPPILRWTRRCPRCPQARPVARQRVALHQHVRLRR